MYEAAPRSLRTVERFLLTPPMTANFGVSTVAVSDISERGARFLHDSALETGQKGVLKLSMDGRPAPLALEAVVVWTQPDSGGPAKFVSGVRTYGSPQVVQSLIAQLQMSNRSNRIEELRSSERFVLKQSLGGTLDGRPVKIENISARGARIETVDDLSRDTTAKLVFAIGDMKFQFDGPAKVVWTIVKAISGGEMRTYRAGLYIPDKADLMRLAIAHLADANIAMLDTQSLALKLKIMRARARQFAPNVKSIETLGVPAEQYLLIQGVREELRMNPEEAMHWYRRARLVINDPATRETAPQIASHPDALAVWEYLDRSVDPTIVGRAFEIKS
jgi:hypothetical protein